MALGGPPRSHENELPPRLSSHQCVERLLLLPRMRGVFGRGDFVANGVLFGFYHLHTPWSIPAALADIILTAYPTRRWQSVWMSIIVHSAQSVFVLLVILALVLA